MAAFCSVKVANGVVGLRDITSADIPTIVNYWILAPDEHLTSIGVDRQRIGTQEDIYRRFANAIRTDDVRQSNIALGITLDERLVGYTLLHRYSDDVNYSHWHIIVPNLRAKGLSSALYPHRIRAYFEVAPISQLIHQTRTTNVGVNRMLDRFVPVLETKFVEKPDGVANPGEFHLRYVRREDIPGIFALAAEVR